MGRNGRKRLNTRKETKIAHYRSDDHMIFVSGIRSRLDTLLISVRCNYFVRN